MISGEAVSLDEIHTIAFQLDIQLEEFCPEGRNKIACARELIRYCVARGRFDDLIGAVFEVRPDLRRFYYD